MSEGSDVVAAVDVGGTRIKAALVDASYETLARVTTPTPADITADVGAVVHATVTDLLATAARRRPPCRLVGCGVVVPGLVDEARGVGLFSVNLGWRDLPIRDPVAALLGVPVVVGHDVRAGLLAETRLGAARGVRGTRCSSRWAPASRERCCSTGRWSRRTAGPASSGTSSSTRPGRPAGAAPPGASRRSPRRPRWSGRTPPSRVSTSRPRRSPPGPPPATPTRWRCGPGLPLRWPRRSSRR